MPWKNGGGETREIAIHPAQATLDDMQWRISMAGVTTDGPFSLFAGIDRTLCVLQGAGLTLAFNAGHELADAHEHHELYIDSPPLTFAADQPTYARLLGGAIVDLNVMTRRETHRHDVQRLELDAHHTSLDITSTTVLFCEQGNAACTVGDSPQVMLSEHDALVLDERDERACTLAGGPVARVLLIRIEMLPA